tara:strand:- start:749 stop:922 length:174 start_codon:yes stop_codon:yes gene_type:complete
MSKREFEFNKFIKDLTKREEKSENTRRKQVENAETPQREYNRRYRELWQNRIVWKKK